MRELYVHPYQPGGQICQRMWWHKGEMFKIWRVGVTPCPVRKLWRVDLERDGWGSDCKSDPGNIQWVAFLSEKDLDLEAYPMPDAACKIIQ